MGLSQSFNKDKEREIIRNMLTKIGASEGLEYGSIKVEYELKFQNGKPVRFIARDPFEHSIFING